MTMNFKSVFCCLTALAVIITGGSVSAMTAQQTDEDVITITGKLENVNEAQQIGVRLYVHNKNFSDIQSHYSEVLKYHDQKTTEKDGSYEFLIKMNENDKSGIYDVRLYSAEGVAVDATGDETVIYTSKNGQKIAFEKLYSDASVLSSKENFVSFAEEYRYDLRFTGSLNKIADEAAAFDMLYTYLTANRVASAEELRIIYEKCLMMVGINSGALENIYGYLGIEHIKDSNLKGLYNAEFVLENTGKEMTVFMKKLNAATILEFDEKLVDAFILAMVKAPNGYSNLEDVLRVFASKINVSVSKITTSLCRNLAGQDGINSLSALKTYIDSFEESGAGGSGGSGSAGGSGGGSGGSGGSGGISSGKSESVVFETIPGTENEPIPTEIFNDIDSVPWAKNAIVYLAEKNIINGYGNGKFEPDRLVAREEFVKMIAEAFLDTEKEADVEFEDVSLNEWYSPYIKRAVGYKLINGVSETRFGIGENITREDMAVIAYRTMNSLKMLNETTEDRYKLFEDDAELADYSKKAVYNLRAAGIINGVSETIYQPKGIVTRAQAAMLIYNMINGSL